MATHDGFVTRKMIEFYQSFARGGAGMVNIGDSAVDSDYAPAHFGQLNLGDDRAIGVMSTLVEAVQKYGAKISIELDHSGRLSPPRMIGGKNPIGPSPVPSRIEEMTALMEGRKPNPVTEMDQAMIDEVIDHFAMAEPIIPDIPGVKGDNVVWAGDIDTGKASSGEKVLIAGAGLTGCETALMLSQYGKKVTIIDMLSESEIAADAAFVSRVKLLEMLHENGVQFKTEVKLEEITGHGALVTDRKGNKIEIPADTVVLSLGVRALNESAEDLRGLAKESHVIGDCVRPRNLMSAIHEGFNITAEM
jgi:hypothetical protein